MAFAFVGAVVDHLHVVDAVGTQIGEQLVVCFGREHIVAVVELEAVVHACDEVDGALALDFLVE